MTTKLTLSHLSINVPDLPVNVISKHLLYQNLEHYFANDFSMGFYIYE